MDILIALQLARRIALAVSNGLLKADEIEALTDEDLARYDDEAFAALGAKQAEADALEKQLLGQVEPIAPAE